ncbi:MAG TPA: hypothetical protein VJY34_20325 [Roseiarcus sp.]|nr:hypothetical protein [Roseiarcus sp.]
MFRLALILGAASFVAVLGLSIAADAQTAVAGKPAGEKFPMDPSTLSTRSGAHVRQRPRDNYAHDTFNQPTPIQGTMAGPRM